MASILDKYAIKEVADVMFYELDSKGAPSAPVLYLDSLKVSTIEQSSETVDATGGKGNVKLLSWDTNKEITLTLEDALFSAKSLGIMFGGTMKQNGANQEVLKTVRNGDITEIGVTTAGSKEYFKFTIKNKEYAIAKIKATYFIYNDGEVEPSPVVPSASITAADFDFMTFDLLDCTAVTSAGLAVARNDNNSIITNGMTIDITSNFDSNTYYITGDTFARNYESGQDEFLQFIVPKGKVSAEDVSLTMEADGDPATFSMTVNCLKANDGSMIKLVKYNLTDGTEDSIGNKGVASVLDQYNDSGDKENAGYVSGASIADGSLNDAKPISDLSS